MKPILLVWLSYRGVPEFTATREQVEVWAKRVPELEVVFASTQEEFIRNLSKATYAMTFTFSEAWLPLTYRLKWMATERIRLTHGTFHGEIMAETVIGMLLALRRGLLPGLGLCTASEPWPEAFQGRALLAGSRSVILGYGNIGKAIGAKLEALGGHVLGITRSNFGELDGALPEADALILALPATPETARMVDATRLARLPKRAVVVNVGRGSVLDEEALQEALVAGRLYAAFLDVLQEEPYPEDGALRKTPRCFLLPHASAFAPDYLERAFEEWLELYRREVVAPEG